MASTRPAASNLEDPEVSTEDTSATEVITVFISSNIIWGGGGKEGGGMSDNSSSSSDAADDGGTILSEIATFLMSSLVNCNMKKLSN